MNRDQLKRGEELVQMIETCEKALNQMESAGYSHGKYYLNVSEHSDGSGYKLDLCGIDVLKIKQVIKEEVQKQLEDYQTEFENL